MKTINLDNGVGMEFDIDTPAIWAVVYGYCTDNGRLPELFSHGDHHTLEQFYNTLPIVKGRNTITCGDWCTMY